MACLGDPSRFRLVQALIGGARCVTDLAAEVGLSQSCTTRHLQALERRNVVRGTRDGKRVLYRIRDDRPDLMPLIGWAMEAHGPGGLPGQAPGRGPFPVGRNARQGRARVNGSARATRPAPPEGPTMKDPLPVAELPVISSPAPRAEERSTAPVPADPVRDQEPRPTYRRRDTELEDFLL
jgi:ArsR family transcriptional regulator